MEKNISILYHSGFGHTAKVALAVAEGAKKIVHTKVTLINVLEITEQDWITLDDSHAIIFGCPTYMGGVSAKFKEILELSSGRWFNRKWKDKIAAGFTNSGSYSGDKLNTLFQLMVNAMQHGMIWVGNAILAPSPKGIEGPGSSDLNRVGSYMGLATQSNNDSPDIVPPIGDLETAKLFGERIANITHRFKG